MSDVDEFKMNDTDDLAVDYLREEYGSSKGSVKLGLGVGAILTIIFELFVGLVLDAQHNLVHRYAAYMLGIVVLFVVSVFTKSTWKMIFFGTPMVILLSFALPLAAPSVFAGLLSPFANTLPTLLAVLDSMKQIGTGDASSLENTIQYVQTYGYVVDLIFAMLVGTFAGIGLVGLVKIFSKKPNILTPISFLFSAVFFLLGVVILPYVLVVSSGVTQFGLDLSAGALNLTHGFDVSQNNSTDAARPFFAEAEKWFKEAEQMLNGLKSLQAFTLLGTALPDYKLMIDNMLALVNTAVNMAQAVAPMFLGMSELTNGITQSMAVVSSLGSSLSLNQLTDQQLADFEAGITQMRQGFQDIKSALPEINDAIAQFADVQKDQIKNSGQSTAQINDGIDTIDATVRLVNVTLVVFDVLITPYNSTSEEPFVHLLRGALAMKEVSNAIGSDSNYGETAPYFNAIIGNLTIVVDALTNEKFVEFVAVDVLGVNSVESVKEGINGIFEFIKDVGNIAINIGYYGLIAVPALHAMNSTMTKVTGEPDFTNITQAEYDLRLVEFNDTSTGITKQATDMQVAAATLVDSVKVMADKSTNSSKPYGYMQSAAADFATLFGGFRFQEDANNFYYMSFGLENTIRSLKRISLVRAEVNDIQTEFNILNGYTWPDNNTEITISINNINSTLNSIQISLDILNVTLTDAAGNFSLTTMKDTAQSSHSISNTDPTDPNDSIGENVIHIQGFRDNILNVTTNYGSIGSPAEFSAALTSIQTNIDNIVTEIGYVNTNAKQIKIS